METRSRKRAEASSSTPPTTRAAKRSRTSSSTSSPPPSSAARSRRPRNPPMDDSSSRRRRDSTSDKGKEPEPSGSSSRDRDRRDVERILGLSFDSAGADDDSDAAAGGILHQNLTSASSALQGLLRKLGAGLDDLLPSHAISSSSSHLSGRLKKILSGLRSDGEEGRQVEALTQLCEMLSIGTEDSLGSFSVDSFVPVLVGLLNHESNADIMLLAARAITHLCDVLPSSCAAVVHYGAVPCFCARLLTIEYMDLAEQSLQALKKISQEHPTACLRAGALMAVLSYLDFFSTGVQRVALSTAANICKKLPSDAADFVMEAVPLLTNLLHYHDSKVLEHASVCLTRIAEAFTSSPERLDELCNHGLVAQAADLISISNSGGQASLSTPTYTGLIRLLSTCASGSPLGSKTLLLLGISGILKDILSGSGLVATVSVSSALTRPAEQIYEIVTLADELLPPLPQGTISLPVSSNILIKGSVGKKAASNISGKPDEANDITSEVSAREKLLQDQPELLQQFGIDLLPVLTQIYGSSVNGPVRHKCLSAIGKLMYFSSADMIQSLLNLTNISSFLGGVLAWKDPQVLIPALQIAEILMEKLPETFSTMFVREGVVHAVDALIRSDTSTAGPSDKDNDCLPGSSTRSRRYRRRNSGLNTDSSPLDESKGSVTGTSSSPPTSVEVPNANSTLRAAVSACAKAFRDKYFPTDPGATEVGVTDDLLHLKSLCSKLNGSIEDVKSKTKGLAAVEEFLWPRIQRSDSGQKLSALTGNPNSGATAGGAGGPSPSTSTPATGRRPSTRSRASVTIDGAAKKDPSEGNASSSKGKGKAVLKSTDEGRGPQTRNAARRRAASDKDTEMKPVHGDSSSEDEELDMSHVEIDDDALMIEEDDVSEDDDDDDDENEVLDDSLPGCTPEKVHDVKLADPSDDTAIASSLNDGQALQPSGSGKKATSARGAEPAELRSGSAFGSRGAMSFAAAAMAGLASVGGRGGRVGRDRHGLNPGGSLNDLPNKLIFTAGGKQLSKHMTIYQAVQRQLVLDEDDDARFNSSESMPSDGSRFWSDIFTITYQKADSPTDNVPQEGSSSIQKSSKTSSVSSSGSDSRWQQMSLIDSILQGELPCDLDKSNPTYNIVALLRVLEVLNQLAPRLRLLAVSDDFAEGKITSLDELYRTGSKVPSEEFINSKLTPKLARQMQDALALCSGSLPSWCFQMTKSCPFLFPFETRRQYFYSTAFGLSRALHRLQQQQSVDNNSSANEREVRVGRLQRQKVRVSRNRILDSAAKVMEMYSSQKAVLEVEYFGEVGTGLGPTLEFYTLLSHDMQKAGLGLWRSNYDSDKYAMQIDGDEENFVNTNEISDEKKLGSNIAVGRNLIQTPLGLFPRPWPPTTDVSDGSKLSKAIEYFRLLGRVMAKALQDGRLLDLPLSTAFYKLVLGQELDLYDILLFDADFGKILQEMHVLVYRKKFLEATPGNSQKAIADLRFRGSPIEDLCLDFTLPGYPEYILKDGEESTMVTIHNLEEYISSVVDATVKTGITRQLDAFKAGFNQVFDVSSLQIFSPNELDYLICGRRELWQPETLVDHIKFDHGYTAKSPAIINLLEIMGEFTPEQQHAFCRFVTGAPRLPPGGLAALNPKLTIVRKQSSSVTNTTPNGSGASETADDALPSVMTCANYLKLPPYSTKEIMYKKLLYAICEGQGSFDLS